MERVSWLVEGVLSGGPAVASALLFAAFGAAVAWLLGLRGAIFVVAGGLPTGIAALVVVAHLLGSIGLNGGAVGSAAATLALAGVVAAVREGWRRTRCDDPHQPAAGAPRDVWIGAAIGVVVAGGVWLAGIGDFAIPPQSTDDIWHGYLVERLTHVDRITVATMVPLTIDSPTPAVYYQYGLHLAGALVNELTGISVAQILNGMWLVWIGGLLPFGVAATAWLVFRERPRAALFAGALSSAVIVFPYLTNGILPYTLALAMTPGVLVLGLGLTDRIHRVPMLVLALAALGVFVTHPSAAVAAAILAALLVGERLVREPSRATLVRVAMTGVLAAAISVPWLLASGNIGLGDTDATTTVSGASPALLMLLGLGSPWTGPQPVLAVLAVIGVVAAVAWRRGIGLAMGFAFFGTLYVGVLVGAPASAELAVPWHGDWHRLIPIVGVLVPTLAGAGVDLIFDGVRRLVPRVEPGGRRRAATIAAAAVVAIGGLFTAYGVARAQSIVREAWHAGGLLNAQDLELMDELAALTGPDDKILSSPVDGSTWIYPLDGVEPVLPYPAGSTLLIPDLVAGEGIYGDPGVSCRTLQSTAATYALVKQVRGDDPNGDYDIGALVARYPDLFEPVLQTDTSAAYRIDQEALAACAALPPPAG